MEKLAVTNILRMLCGGDSRYLNELEIKAPEISRIDYGVSIAGGVNNRKCKRWRSWIDKGNGRRNAFSAMTCWFVTLFVFE